MIRLRNLQRKIEKEKNLERKIDLLSKQNSIIGYLATIGIVIDTKDKSLASKIAGLRCLFFCLIMAEPLIYFPLKFGCLVHRVENAR